MKFVREEGREEGLAAGCEYTLKLTKLLMDAGRLDDLKRATEDNAFFQELCEEFHIV